MKKFFIIANWKSNKTEEEIRDWFTRLRTTDYGLQTTGEKEIIICPSFVHLSLVQSLIKEHNLPFKVGAQDISPFSGGPYTGEVNEKQIKEFADYVLVGHSERREHFNETEEMLSQKVKQCKENNLEPIYFIPSETAPVPEGISFLVYEPPNSISTNPNAAADDPQNVNKIAGRLKEKYGSSVHILYGGSVNSKNSTAFLELEYIEGVVPGKASLDALEFASIIEHA